MAAAAVAALAAKLNEPPQFWFGVAYIISHFNTLSVVKTYCFARNSFCVFICFVSNVCAHTKSASIIVVHIDDTAHFANNNNIIDYP